MNDHHCRPRSVAVIGTRGYPSYYGGFETAIRKLAPHLAEEGWDVTVYGRRRTVAATCPTRDPRVRSVDAPGIESRALSTLSHGLTATLHALVRRPDVALVMNCANGFWLPLLRLRGIPTLVNVDGIEWERDKWSPLAKTVFRLGARLTARWADRLVYDAEAIGERWRQDLGADGVFIPYGGDESPPTPLEPPFRSGTYVLAVARFVPENTIAEFLDAASDLARTHDVVVVGSSGYGGALDDRARALSEELPRFHWLGHLSDDRRLHALWQHAGVYFHGHSVGGTNPALVQAMFLGSPTVARDTVYNREVLGDAGTFVTASPDEIASTIRDFLSDGARRAELARRGRARARRRYTWRSVTERYERELRALANTHRRRTREQRTP